MTEASLCLYTDSSQYLGVRVYKCLFSTFEVILSDFDRASSLICGNKMPTRCNMIFIADLMASSTCFRHHYAHHQELESIIQVVAVCGIWCFGFQVVGMVWS